MTKYIGQRLLSAIPTVLGVCLIVFLLMYFSPYDAAREMGRINHLNAEQIENLRQEMGLNKPFGPRLAGWFVNLLKGDLGKSFIQRMPVTDMIAARLWTTAELALWLECSWRRFSALAWEYSPP